MSIQKTGLAIIVGLVLSTGIFATNESFSKLTMLLSIKQVQMNQIR
jgi:hypothetical protein